MKKSIYWATRKGMKVMMINEMSKMNYNEKEVYLTKLCGKGTDYNKFKFYYNEKWDIKIRLFKDSTYDLI